jgi:hypothetical protein
MSEPTFRTGIRAFYEGQRLPEESLERLRGLARVSRAPVGRRGLLKIGLAASVILAAVAILLSGRRGDVTAEVAREIARNHQRGLDPEFLTASYEEAAARMARLDFRIKVPRHPQAEGLRIVGARYCSLRGCVAAQLRLVGADGRSRTLYQVRDCPAFDGVLATRIDVEAVAVDLWREGGLLLGLASTGA